MQTLPRWPYAMANNPRASVANKDINKALFSWRNAEESTRGISRCNTIRSQVSDKGYCPVAGWCYEWWWSSPRRMPQMVVLSRDPDAYSDIRVIGQGNREYRIKTTSRPRGVDTDAAEQRSDGWCGFNVKWSRKLLSSRNIILLENYGSIIFLLLIDYWDYRREKSFEEEQQIYILRNGLLIYYCDKYYLI